MAGLARYWERLSLQRKGFLVGGVLAMMVLLAFMARSVTAPNMALLYGGLDAKAAGEVVAALEGLGVPVEVRGDQIYVPGAERDRARLALAKDGLPAQGQVGYELLDTLTGFGTTTEMFQAAYWRAKEGELQRTILAAPGVKGARVHIGAQARRPFERGGGKNSAAVTVTTAGAALSESAATAIRYMVALSVAGLAPEDVAVIDSRHGVILKPGDDASLAGSSEETRRGETLRSEIEELLAVRVGPGNVRVSVTVETTKEARSISERTLDPESQVTMSAETEEVTEQSQGAPTAVTVASNLPDGAAAGGGGQAQSNRSETRENNTYQYSETRRDETVRPGAVKRIGVAVLVDEIETVAADGTSSFATRGADELDAIEQLVKSAIAFDADRGDVVTVESMRFADIADDTALAEVGFFDRFLADNLGQLAQITVLGLVALALGLFVVRPILAAQAETARLEAEATSAAIGVEVAPIALGAAGATAALAGGEPASALPSELEALALSAPDSAAAAEVVAAFNEGGLEAARATAAMLRDGADDAADGKGVSKTKIELLREVVGEKGEESVALLKRWLNTTPGGQTAENERSAA